MTDERAHRQDLRRTLDGARALVRGFSGLYRDEDLPADVLRLCDEAGDGLAGHPDLGGARRLVETRCRRLAQVADRFSQRDPLAIAAARSDAVAALDDYQDAVLTLRKRVEQPTDPSAFLRRRSD